MKDLWENERSEVQTSFILRRGNVSARYSLGREEDVTKAMASEPSNGVDETSAVDGVQEEPAPPQMVLSGLGISGHPAIVNQRFTFKRFVVGPSNRFAYHAALAVAHEKRASYNPLYIYGGGGLGKSHLSGAIGNHIRSCKPGTRILYVTAEEFVNEMVLALRKREMNPFKEKYRKGCDILFIDGVHFFSGKKTTQGELSHTFDHLYNAGKRIVLTGAVPPHEIGHMTDGLKSRLAGGLVVDIHPPEFDTRRRILRQKAAFDGVILPNDVIDFLASQVSGNVRRLEGILINLTAKSSFLYRPIDLELAQEVFQSLQIHDREKITIGRIHEMVSRHYHVKMDYLSSRSRRKSVCHPRQLAMYLCRKFTDEPLESIGKAFCRDHASVIHSIGVVEKKMREKAGVRREVEFLAEKLGLQGDEWKSEIYS